LLAGAPAMLEVEGDKPAVQALREMGEGFVSWDMLFDQDDQERRRAAAAAADEEAEGTA